MNTSINRHSGTYLNAYRFGFNGKEKVDEINGSGNDMDFGARIYDARLGRWLSVDARFAKYPDLSPFTFSENNPIIMVDNGGDSTVYYSARGSKLWVSHDGLENAIVIVDDNQLIRFRRNVEAFKKLKVGDGNGANEHLRKMGKVYPIEQFENFYRNYSKKHTGGGKLIVDGKVVTKIKVGNEIRPVFDEYAVALSNIGNNICIDGVPMPGGPMGSSASGGDAILHLHPIPRGPITLIFDDFLGNKSSRSTEYPSTASQIDRENVGNGRNVVIDNKSIIIYGSDESKDVKFDTTVRFSKK